MFSLFVTVKYNAVLHGELKKTNYKIKINKRVIV